MKKSERTKEDMIRAVIGLIEEGGNTDFSIGMIANRADVAVGLINYHYESKQALIIEAIRHYVNEKIAQDSVFMIGEHLSPREQLATSLKSYADFLVNHSSVSRLHIKYSFEGDIGKETLSQAMLYYLPLINDSNHKINVEQSMTILRMIVSTIQLSFLESDIMKQTSGLNFYCKEERDQLIDNMITLTIG